MRSQLIETNRHSHHLIAHGELITSHYTTTTRCAHHLTLFHSSYLIFPCGSRSLLPLCFTPSPWPCFRHVIRNYEPLDVCENKQNELCFAHHFDARSSSDDNLHFTPQPTPTLCAISTKMPCSTTPVTSFISLSISAGSEMPSGKRKSMM